MKKRIIISAAVLVIVAAVVCLLPWPTFVNITMTGSFQNGEKAAEKPVEITVQGIIWNYLFFPDKVDLDFNKVGAENWVFIKPTEPERPMNQRLEMMPYLPYIIAGHGAYSKQGNHIEIAQYAFDVRNEMLLIYIMNDSRPIIACSAGGEKTTEEIKEHFEYFVEMFSTTYD